MLDLLDRIDRYLVGETTARELEIWLISNLQRILDSKDESAINLANAVDAGLVNLSEKVIDIAEFHSTLDALMRAARTHDFEFGETKLSTNDIVDSENELVVLDIGDPFRVVTVLQLSHSFA